ncbi:MAG: riboflavin synthase [Chitinophagaceae bacterium]|nr:riboflavin synthase [Chitinophagaceae bacterium]
MFTGIIETQGIIRTVTAQGSGKTFWLSSPITRELKVDQSVSHDGVCLTVEEISGDQFRVTAIQETLRKTNLEHRAVGDTVNIERCLAMNGRLDGHLVQGHVDGTGTCTERNELEGSWEFNFEFADQFADLIIEKGSICLNGISLTAFNVKRNRFTVAIIPYTFDHTNIRSVQPGNEVNLEFDVIGKYIQRKLSLQDPTHQ